MKLFHISLLRLKEFCSWKNQAFTVKCILSSILFLCLGCKYNYYPVFMLSDAHWRVETNLDKICAANCGVGDITLPNDFVLEYEEIPLFSHKDELIVTGRVIVIKERSCWFNHQSVDWFKDYYIDLDAISSLSMSNKIIVTVNMHGVKSIESFEAGDFVQIVYLPVENVIVDLIPLRDWMNDFNLNAEQQ